MDLGDPSYRQYIELLASFCREAQCFALAAVQIGIPLRFVYLKNTTLNIPLDQQGYDEAKILINPVVISRRGLTEYWEACVSCLDNTGLVSRPYEMVVEYYDGDGGKRRDTFTGFEATVLSHELDHLDGILHMDIAEKVLQLSPEERKLFREKHPYEIISKTCEYETKLSSF